MKEGYGPVHLASNVSGMQGFLIHVLRSGTQAAKNATEPLLGRMYYL